MMRLKILVLSMTTLFVVGFSIVSLRFAVHLLFSASSSSSFTSQEQGFTKEEAEAKIGRRVRVIDCSSLKLIGKRRDDPEGGWLDLTIGERGTVKKMEQVAPNEYYLIVFWDEPKEEYPYRSYYRKAKQFSVYSECLAEE